MDTTTRPRVYRSRGRKRLLALRASAVALALLGGVAVTGWKLAENPPVQVPTARATALSDEIVTRFAAAQVAAADQGIELTIRSGWRSADEQERLYQEAVREKGVDEARRQVLPPERSAHVAGTAVDVAPLAGAQWLEANASTFGLCRTYANEWWHFEVTGAIGEPCPELKPDASVDW